MREAVEVRCLDDWITQCGDGVRPPVIGEEEEHIGARIRGIQPTLKVWDLRTGEAIRTLEGHADCVNAVAVTPDGSQAVSASDDQTLRVWDLRTGSIVATFHGDVPLGGCAVAADGSVFVCGDSLGRVHFLRLEEASPAKDETDQSARRRPTRRGRTSKPPPAQYDVFLAHNSKDKSDVLAVAEALKRRGIRPWIDVEQIPPGRWFQDIIQAAIPTVKSAAVFLGPHGIGKWQVLELRTFISQCVERGMPVIPVLLPGVEDLPQDLLFLRELTLVKFKERLDEKEALDQLQWGITGKKPGQSQ